MATATQEPRVGNESAEARIEQALAAAGSLLRSRELSVGALLSGAALFAAMAGLVILHGVFRPFPWFGISTLVLAGVAALVVLARTFLRPLVTSINPYYAARTIEAAIPDCRNSVINWLDLRSQPMPQAIKGAVINRAARDLQDLDVAEAVYALPRSRVPVTLFTLSAVLLVVLAFLMGPGPFTHALSRGLTPWADHPVLANTQIEIVSPEGGDGSVAVGRDMAIKVKLTGKVPESGAPDAATLWVWNAPEQAPVAIPMNPGSDPAREPNVWIASVTKDLVQMGFWYRVTAGDNRTSDHRIEVRLDLFIQSVSTQVTPPEYLRQDPVLGAEPSITAIRGSKLTITGLASGNLRSAEMSFYAGAERRLEKTKAALDPADPKRFILSITAAESGQYHFRIVNTAGDPFESSLAPITVNEDQKPVIKLVLPATTPAKLRLVDTEVFKFQISDDFGLAGISGHLALPDGKKLALPASGLPTLPGAKPVQATDGSWTVRAGDLREYAGKMLKLVVSARDARPNDLGLVESETAIEILKNSTEVRLIQPAKEARLKPGQNLSVLAEISGTIPEDGKPDSPRIVYTALGDNRGGQTFPLVRPVANQGRWTGQVPANQIGEGGWVQVLAGDGASPLQKVEIATPLTLNGVSIKVEPPAYIKAPPTVSKDREIKALAGSKAIITLETNVPGVTGGIFHKPEGGAEREIPGNPDIQNTRNLDVSLPLDKAGTYRVVIKGEGNTWRDMGTFPVEVVEDKPPTVELLEPMDGTSVPANGQVLARIKAEDDWGLKSLTVRLEWLAEGRETPLKAVQLPLKTGEAGPAKKHEGIYPLKLPDLRDEQGQFVPLAAGQKLRLKVEARDHHPDPARLGQSSAVLLSLAPPADEEKKKQDEQRDKNKMDQFQKEQQQQQDQNNKNEGQPMQGGKPEQAMNQENKPNQIDKPMPGQGDKPMPGQGDKPMPGETNQPMGGQNDKPMPGEGQKNMAPEIKDVEKRIQDALNEKPNDQPMPGQGDKPMPGMGDKPMPGQGDKPMPGQGDKPMPGQGDKPMAGQGDKPMPGQGDKPMPGQGDKPMPGQGDKPMPGQGDKPMPGQGDKPMPGQGDKPMPGQGDKPMPGQGDKPMPGQGDKPMPGQGDKPMPGQGDKPMPGQGDKPMPGQGDKPMPGQGDKPMPGQGSNDRATAPGMNPTAEDNREAISGSREKPDAVDPANAKAALAQLENLQDQIRRNKDKLKQKGISDEEIRKYEDYLRKRQNNLEKDMNRPDQASPQQAGGLQSVGVRKARGGNLESGEVGSDNRPPPPAEYQDAWREFSRKRKLPADPKLR